MARTRAVGSTIGLPAARARAAVNRAATELSTTTSADSAAAKPKLLKIVVSMCGG